MQLTAELIDAIKNGEVEKTRALLDDHPDLVRAKTETGESVIMLAVYYGRREIAEVLLERIAQLDIFEAAAVGEIEQVVQALQHNPTQLSSFSNDGWTPLHLAAFFGHREIIAYLLDRGAEINLISKNELGVSPLHSALANRLIAIAELLLDRGADIDAQQGAGWTPLHYVAAIGELRLAKRLLAAGADPTVKNANGQTPLDVAIEKGHGHVAELLRS